MTSLTVSIPADYATIQAAIDALDHAGQVTIRIESGHALTAGFKVENGDYGRFTITSAAVVVALAANWPAGSPVAEGINARMPNWGILVDCAGRDTGSQALKVGINSSLWVLDGKGLRNAAGTGLFVHTNSEATGRRPVFTGCAGYNAHITHLSRGYMERGNFTGSTSSGGNVFVSRGSMLYAAGADFSNSIGPGLTIRRSTAVIIPFGGTDTTFDSNGAGAILASDHSTVIAHRRHADKVAFSNCGLHGVHALNGSHIDLRGASFDTVAGDGIRIDNGAQVVMDGAVTFAGIGGNNISQAANVLTGNGVIYNADADSYPLRGSNADGDYVRLADGTQICTRTVTHDLNSSLSQNWRYPMNFCDPPAVSFAVEGNRAADLQRWYARNGSAWATGMGWRTRAPAGGRIPDTVTVQLTATGRWI